MIKEFNNLTIIRKNGILPSIPFLEIKEEILGKNYDLTLIFCSKEESQERNKTYRGRDYPTNILSFPLSKNEGEIYISLAVTRIDSKKFELSYNDFLHLLLIHGLLHLKGLDHGSKMEELEDKYLKKILSEK